MSTQRSSRYNSQRSQVTSQATQRGSQVTDLNHLTGKVIRYILSKSRNKYAIKVQNIKKFVLRKRAEDFKPVMKNVTKKLSCVFSYELRQLPGGQYFLVNKIVNEDIVAVTEKETAEQTLLILTLSYIFMCPESKDQLFVKEEDLWIFFVNLKIITETNSVHPYFGNVKDLISNKFVKQLYLRKVRDRETDMNQYEWGPRAEAEMDYRSILNLVSKVYDDRPLNTWPNQYRAMKNSERSALHNGQIEEIL